MIRALQPYLERQSKAGNDAIKDGEGRKNLKEVWLNFNNVSPIDFDG